VSEKFRALADLRPYAIWNGVTARVVNGDRMTLASIDLGPGVAVPQHHHENEQLGFVIRGSLTFTIDGDSRVLNAGDTYVIPSHVPHDVVAGAEGATVVDVFAPIRADWEKLPRPDPFPPDWPR
jgi:quercetin dioxygenase-like cupin family protein